MLKAIKARRSQLSTVCTSHQITYTVNANGSTVTKPLMVSVKILRMGLSSHDRADAPKVNVQMPQADTIEITPAKPADVPLILALIEELANYEKLRHEVVATEATVGEALFGPRPCAEAVVARIGGEPAGF